MSRIIQYKSLRSVIFAICIITYYLYEEVLHYKAKNAHPGIDPGRLVLKSDTLGHDVKSCTARNNSIYGTENPSIGHIRIRMQGKNFDIFLHC